MLCIINGVQFGIGRGNENNRNIKGKKMEWGKKTEIRDSNRNFILEKFMTI